MLWESEEKFVVEIKEQRDTMEKRRVCNPAAVNADTTKGMGGKAGQENELEAGPHSQSY